MSGCVDLDLSKERDRDYFIHLLSKLDFCYIYNDISNRILIKGDVQYSNLLEHNVLNIRVRDRNKTIEVSKYIDSECIDVRLYSSGKEKKIAIPNYIRIRYEWPYLIFYCNGE